MSLQETMTKLRNLFALTSNADACTSPWLHYTFAFVIFGIATIARFSILPVEAGLPFLTYYPATALTALLFGTGPAMVTMVLGAMVGHYVFIPPFWSWKPEPDQMMAVGIYAASWILISMVADQRRKNSEALKEANIKLLSLSRVDDLTGAANKRWLFEILEMEWARAIRSKSSIGFLMIDIDYFKNYNDNYGHPSGDKCLKDVVNAITNVVRHPPDMVARYGGEEFVCLLPGADLAGTAAVGQRVLEEIRSRLLPHGFSGVADHITVSIGGASMMPVTEQDMCTLIEAADCLLYRAKDAGRDRLVTDCFVCGYPACTQFGAKLPCQHIRRSHEPVSAFQVSVKL